ncbi:MAG: hypothetical protein IKE18_02095 [Oscillospiraceae bacterium]|nr:hypothetical protein [Oscillospiraceae bacterium]
MNKILKKYICAGLAAVALLFAGVSSVSDSNIITTKMILDSSMTRKVGAHSEVSPFQEYEVVVPTEVRTVKVRVYDPKEAQARGAALSPWRGAVYFGIQKETYYNLPMNGVISIAHSRGIEGEYWVNEYGCKMLGDYIMVAANWGVHPYGSLVTTSLGMGIVVDTGEFAADNAYQIDVATTW